jgi:hypothetical protein
MLSPKRKGRVTGSVAGAILGLDPNISRYDVMRDMVREYKGMKPLPKPKYVTDTIFAWGNYSEAGAIHELELEAEITISKQEFCEYEDWLGATPDGLGSDMTGHMNIEIKCPFGLSRKKTEPEFKSITELPHYHAQCQIEMLCSKTKYTYFYQWAPLGTKLEVVEYSHAWISENLPKLAAFYDEYLVQRESPYCDRYLTDSGMIELYDDDSVTDYDRVVTAIESLEKRKKEILASMYEKTGGYPALINGRKLTKVSNPGRLSYAKIVKDYVNLSDIDVSKYMGAPSEYIKLSKSNNA